MIQFLALAVMQEKVIDRPAAAFVPALASSTVFSSVKSAASTSAR